MFPVSDWLSNRVNHRDDAQLCFFMDALLPGPDLEHVVDDASGGELALIIRSSHRSDGISFVTDDETVHQLGVLCWPRGHVIDAHVHNVVERTIS